jgi:hypothetical protein
VIFVDHLVMSQRVTFADVDPAFVGPLETPVPTLAGIRRLSYRERGDINNDGEIQGETEVVSDSQSAAWLHGSHETRIQMKSDGFVVLMAGNPGRFGRPDNIFNLNLDQTLKKANDIALSQGFPPGLFRKGQPIDYQGHAGLHSPLRVGRVDEQTENKFDGSRVWGIHMTQNYVTGSPSNLKHVVNWLATQSVRRVTSKRRGDSTLEFGAIGYCQTQLYDKAMEMLAHCRNKEERELMMKTDVWKYAHEKGLLRVEVKCAKDFLVHKGLTYLGAWDMGKVIEIFKERTELLTRLEVEVDELDVQRLPKSVRTEAAAWLAGVDLRAVLPRSTFFRKADILDKYGLDVRQKRDVAVVRPIMRQIEIVPAEQPEWYSFAAA